MGTDNITSNYFYFFSVMALTGDIYKIILPEATQKTIHCLVGEQLFVDKTWCTVKKADILKDVAAQQAHSPFYNMMNKIHVSHT